MVTAIPPNIGSGTSGVIPKIVVPAASETGAVGYIGDDYYGAILKAMLSVGYSIPIKNIMLSTGSMRLKVELLNGCRMLTEKG